MATLESRYIYHVMFLKSASVSSYHVMQSNANWEDSFKSLKKCYNCYFQFLLCVVTKWMHCNILNMSGLCWIYSYLLLL